MNTIKIELCAEDRARLDKIIETLMQLNGSNHINVNNEASTPTHPAEFEQLHMFESPVNTGDEPALPKPAPVVAREDVRKLATMLLSQGKKEQVKSIVNVYAASITDLPEESLFDVHEKLTALKEV